MSHPAQPSVSLRTSATLSCISAQAAHIKESNPVAFLQQRHLDDGQPVASNGLDKGDDPRDEEDRANHCLCQKN